jgi:hypothetical protein
MEGLNRFRKFFKASFFLALGIILVSGCKTGQLEDEVTSLTIQKAQAIAQRDSLQSLLTAKTTAYDTVSVRYNTLTDEYNSLENRNKSLQSGYYKRGTQLKALTAENESIKSELDNKTAEAESLRTELAASQQKLAGAEGEKAEAEKANALLTQTVVEKQAKITADSIAEINKPKPVKETGFISINEVGAGFGLGDTSEDYGRYIVSVTTIAGYRINNRFSAGLGAGINFYNGGNMIPVFLDFRYRFGQGKVNPFLVADGGVAISPDGLNSSALFLNPGFGIEKKLNTKVAFHLTGGIHTQQGPDGIRNSFFNFKGGVSFMGK